MTPARWAALAALAFALYFAIQGGEYGTTHLLQLRREEAEELLQRRYDRLQGYGRFTDTKADAR